MSRRRNLHDFESRTDPLLSRAAFAQRMATTIGIWAIVVGVSLLAGMVGYHSLEGMAWIDAFASASMIMSGMGPLTPMKTIGGKLFAGLYALYSGLLLILATGFVLAPVAHRLLHKFHLESKDEEDD